MILNIKHDLEYFSFSMAKKQIWCVDTWFNSYETTSRKLKFFKSLFKEQISCRYFLFPPLRLNFSIWYLINFLLLSKILIFLKDLWRFTMPRPHKHRERDGILQGGRCRSLDEIPVCRNPSPPCSPVSLHSRKKRLKGSVLSDWELETPVHVTPADTDPRAQLTGDESSNHEYRWRYRTCLLFKDPEWVNNPNPGWTTRIIFPRA